MPNCDKICGQILLNLFVRPYSHFPLSHGITHVFPVKPAQKTAPLSALSGKGRTNGRYNRWAAASSRGHSFSHFPVFRKEHNVRTKSGVSLSECFAAKGNQGDFTPIWPFPVYLPQQAVSLCRRKNPRLNGRRGFSDYAIFFTVSNSSVISLDGSLVARLTSTFTTIAVKNAGSNS